WLGAEHRGGEEGRGPVQDDADRVAQPWDGPGRDEGEGEGDQDGAGEAGCAGTAQQRPAERGGAGEPEHAGGEQRLVAREGDGRQGALEQLLAGLGEAEVVPDVRVARPQAARPEPRPDGVPAL